MSTMTSTQSVVRFCFVVFCCRQSTGSDTRLTAETDSMYAAFSADTESNTDAQLDVSPRAGKEFVNPRGIRFTTVSSHGLEGWPACSHL